MSKASLYSSKPTKYRIACSKSTKLTARKPIRMMFLLLDIYVYTYRIYSSLLLLFILICSSLSVTVPYNTVQCDSLHFTAFLHKIIQWCVREEWTEHSSFTHRNHCIPNLMPVVNREIWKTKYVSNIWNQRLSYPVWCMRVFRFGTTYTQCILYL